MRFEALASSSHGNAYIVSDRDTRVLLECGMSHKKLKELTGHRLSEIDACLISHEHKDHSGCAEKVIRDGIPTYMSQGTAEALGLEGAVLDAAVAMEHGEQFSVGTVDIVPFAVFHDAKEPLGFLLRSRLDGESVAFATDTVNLAYRFPEVTILAIEANYDDEMLSRCDRMPEKVKHRIRNTHMEIGTLCRYLSEQNLSKCREIWLLHLSDATSREWEFVRKVRKCVPNHVHVEVCGR